MQRLGCKGWGARAGVLGAGVPGARELCHHSPELHALNTEHCGTTDGGGTGLCRCGLECGWEAAGKGWVGQAALRLYLI